jgi:hypothetical protein
MDAAGCVSDGCPSFLLGMSRIMVYDFELKCWIFELKACWAI